MRCLILAFLGLWLGASAYAQEERLVRSFLPSSRSVAADDWATVFMAWTNAGDGNAANCTIRMNPSQLTPPNDFFVHEIDESGAFLLNQTRQVFDLPAGTTRHFIIGIRPRPGAFNSDWFGTGDVINYGPYFYHYCTETASGRVSSALGTDAARLDILGFGERAPADILPVIVTPSGDGILRVDPETGIGLASVAAINLGAPADLIFNIEAFADLDVLACRSDANGACLTPRGAAVPLSLATNEIAYFSIVVRDRARSRIPLAPAFVRLWVRFDELSDTDIGSLGSTSVAVTDNGAPDEQASIMGIWRTGLRNTAMSLRLTPDGRYILYSSNYSPGRSAGYSLESTGSFVASPGDAIIFIAGTPDVEFDNDEGFSATINLSDGIMTLIHRQDTQRAVMTRSITDVTIAGEYVVREETHSYRAPFDPDRPRIVISATGDVSGEIPDIPSNRPPTGDLCTISGNLHSGINLSGCSLTLNRQVAAFYPLEFSRESARVTIARMTIMRGNGMREFSLYAPDLR